RARVSNEQCCTTHIGSNDDVEQLLGLGVPLVVKTKNGLKYATPAGARLSLLCRLSIVLSKQSQVANTTGLVTTAVSLEEYLGCLGNLNCVFFLGKLFAVFCTAAVVALSLKIRLRYSRPRP
ncbi:unnamed protein product, partial [Laminaria digitata]